MSRSWLRIIRIFAALVALFDGALLALLLFWLIVNGGYVECGKGVLDGADWPFVFFYYVAPPVIIFIGLISLIAYCSRRLRLR